MLYLAVNKYSGSYSEKKIRALECAVKTCFQNYKFIETSSNEGKVSLNLNPNNLDHNDIIAAVGGDGTINICLQFINDYKLQEIVTLGIIPLGTGNNMLRSLNLSKNFTNAVQILKKGDTEKISYGTVNGEKAFFNCSLGFSSYVLNNRKTNSLTGYYFDTLRLLPLYKGCRIKISAEDKPIELFAGFFINTKVYISKFKFLKSNNSERKLRFFYITKGIVFKASAQAAMTFFSSKFYKLIEADEFTIELSGDAALELDGDIYITKEPNNIYKVKNVSCINVIKG